MLSFFLILVVILGLAHLVEAFIESVYVFIRLCPYSFGQGSAILLFACDFDGRVRRDRDRVTLVLCFGLD